MSYAIMRTKKLKMGGAAASLSHTFRERDTPNADPDLKHTNISFKGSAMNSADAMDALRERLPERYRKDAVVAIEYLMTTSPDWAENATQKEQNDFFFKSKIWLNKKHGKENVFVAQVHNDEKTPHLVAYVVPISNEDPDKAPNRLCAKDFLGGKGKLSKMQTSFHDAVKHLGLERGIEGSKATHQRVQQHYTQVNQDGPQIKVGFRGSELEPQKLGAFKKETNGQVANRINAKLVDSVNEAIAPVIAKANERDAALRQAKSATQTAKSMEIKAQALQKLTNGLNSKQIDELAQLSMKMQDGNRQLAQDLQAQKQIDALVRDDERKMRNQNKKDPKIGM